jgi:hypothetical protein
VPECQLHRKICRREALCLAAALLASLTSLWQLALFAQDNSFLDGICAALGTEQLPPEARALRLFRWTSRYDDGVSPSDPAVAPPTGELLTPRAIVEHRGYFQANCGSKASLLVALARRAGLNARELRLCDSSHLARHVVCELQISGAWAVLDPTVDLVFRRPDGTLAAAADLCDPTLLAANAARARRYDLRYWRFDHAERLHFEKLPVLGGLLRRVAPHLTGRPAEEFALPAAFERPRLLMAGSFAAIALLALASAGRSAHRRRQTAAERSHGHLFPRQEPALEAE